MDRNRWVSTLLLLLYSTFYTSGEMMMTRMKKKMAPENVTVHIWEGNITVTWEGPQENPGNYRYQVQLCNYLDSPSVWVNVSQCFGLISTICNIGYLPTNTFYKIRVGVLTPQNTTSWSYKRDVNVRLSQLLPPMFTLSSTTNSVRVRIDRKPILSEIFSNELLYTVHLWPKGHENQTLLMSDDDTDDAGEITFNSLWSFQEYCMFVKVENPSSDATNVSSVHCVKLPLDITMIICTVLMGLGAITVLLMLFICFLRRPRKMPSALKLAVNVWKPMIVRSDHVETVTDKGWVVINSSDLNTTKSFTEEDKERRGSLDSGVSIEHLHLSSREAKIEGPTGDGHVDSGCESLKGSEVSENGRRDSTEFSKLELDSGGKTAAEGEDSGLGLGCHEVSGSLEGEDTGLLSEVVVGDGYRTQSPSRVDVQNGTDLSTAAPSAGYRSGRVTCTCSEHEYCIWCKCKNVLTEDCPPVTQAHADFSGRGDGESCRYLKKSLMRVVNLLDAEVPVTEASDNYLESSLSLFSCPLLLENEKQDSFMNTFTLDHMELTFS